jgi:dihydrofolate reductase
MQASAMRTSVFVGVSLDGFLAGPNGELDWLPPGGGPEHGYEAFFASVDALVIGRKTYEVVLAFEKWPYGGKPVFVLSAGSLAPPPDGAVVERLDGEPAGIVAALSARGFGHLYVDGGLTIQRFLRAGLIDRLVVTRVPVRGHSALRPDGPRHPARARRDPVASGRARSERVSGPGLKGGGLHGRLEGIAPDAEVEGGLAGVGPRLR